MTLPTVAVVGRPNVGKSTLVNRIVGARVTIVEEKPGVTRDRKEVEAEWQGVPFTLVDTGGWMPGGDTLDAKVSRQSEQAIRDADAVIMVMDAITGRHRGGQPGGRGDPQPGRAARCCSS